MDLFVYFLSVLKRGWGSRGQQSQLVGQCPLHGRRGRLGVGRTGSGEVLAGEVKPPVPTLGPDRTEVGGWVESRAACNELLSKKAAQGRGSRCPLGNTLLSDLFNQGLACALLLSDTNSKS